MSGPPKFRSVEFSVVLPGGLWIFLVLVANFLARPVRDTVAVDSGIAQYLFIYTAIATFLMNPVVAIFISRWRRSVSVAVMHVLFAVILTGLWALMTFGAQDTVAKWSGFAFYVWLSVFGGSPRIFFKAHSSVSKLM